MKEYRIRGTIKNKNLRIFMLDTLGSVRYLNKSGHFIKTHGQDNDNYFPDRNYNSLRNFIRIISTYDKSLSKKVKKKLKENYCGINYPVYFEVNH